MLATLQRLGVVPSFSRPSVSDDNPYSESMSRTLKYTPSFPSKPFESTEHARQWVNELLSGTTITTDTVRSISCLRPNATVVKSVLFWSGGSWSTLRRDHAIRNVGTDESVTGRRPAPSISIVIRRNDRRICETTLTNTACFHPVQFPRAHNHCWSDSDSIKRPGPKLLTHSAKSQHQRLVRRKKWPRWKNSPRTYMNRSGDLRGSRLRLEVDGWSLFGAQSPQLFPPMVGQGAMALIRLHAVPGVVQFDKPIGGVLHVGLSA